MNLWPSRGWEAHGFELKVSRSDFTRELRHPEKSTTIKAYCTGWSLVVPAPWKRVLLSLGELPESWGLVEVSSGRRGGADIVVPAPALEAEEPPRSFFLSLLRSASVAAPETIAAGTSHLPMVPIARPRLARDRVGLLCGHVAPRPLDKVMPRAVPCAACAEGRPTDREIVEAVIADASPEDLSRFEVLLAKRPRVA